MKQFHYIVRVELHNASAEDYQKLHTTMLNSGFGNVIKDDDSQVYKLPTAEYHALEATEFSAVQVRDHVSKLIDALGLNYWVLVSKASEVAWFTARTVVK